MAKKLGTRFSTISSAIIYIYMTQKLRLSHKKILQLDKNTRQAARAANLLYVSDQKPGISRKKKGNSYVYIFQGKLVRKKEELERIKKLAIPPSWTDVWICPSPNGHIQATGIDMNKRKQYHYHNGWHGLRTHTKFHRLYEFGKSLPRLRRKIRKDLKENGLTEKKVLATVVNLMEQTLIRVGSNGYEKLYGSYGLTTLKDKHVAIKKENIRFSFKGKKGIEHSITIRNKKLARIIKQCRDIPGKELFQYYTEEGQQKSIDSGMVNNYIKEAAGEEFSAKDFRTWAGSLHALGCFRTMAKGETATEIRKNIVSVLDEVSTKLGNSRSICRKYYVHPSLIQLYEESKLESYCNSSPPDSKGNGLSAEEKILLSVVKKTM